MKNEKYSLKNFVCGPKQTLVRFEFKNKIVYIVTEFSLYGDLIRKWEIDKVNFSNVKMKGLPDYFLPFDHANSLIGERAFEKNSITFEFLVKPLGLKSFWTDQTEKLFTFYDFKNAMKKVYPDLRIFQPWGEDNS